jgi:paraquat-inducible protein A
VDALKQDSLPPRQTAESPDPLPVSHLDILGGTPLIICEHCDSVYQRPALARRQTAHCVRCGALLERARFLNADQLLALTLAAAILFLFANTFPIMQIGLQGLSNEATLWGTVEALAQGRITPIALVAGLSIIFAPALQIILLTWVLVYARSGQIAPGFSACMRALEHLRPWSMLEVCLLGILVAIIKLGDMADVHPGIGLWATAVLTILILLIAGRDVRDGLWDELGVPGR